MNCLFFKNVNHEDEVAKMKLFIVTDNHIAIKNDFCFKKQQTIEAFTQQLVDQ